jgi:hypothetical protein
MLIAALMAAFAATALPGVAAAEERSNSILLPVAGGLGTANWFLRPHWNTSFLVKSHHRHHHHKKTGSTSGEFPYVVGAIWCAAASPIITVAIEKRELSTNEVLWSTASCFFPPLALIGMFGGLK